jgi:hypothetical protein
VATQDEPKFINLFDDEEEEEEQPKTATSCESFVPACFMPASASTSPGSIQQPEWVNPKAIVDTAPPTWVLVKDENRGSNDDDGYSFHNCTTSSTSASSFPDTGKVIPLAPQAMNGYGKNCVGLRFSSRGLRSGRGRDHERGRPYQDECRPYRPEHQPQFYTFGLHYVPSKGDVDVYRTVVIDMLPAGTRLDSILEYAKEHPVVSSRLIDISKMKLKSDAEGAGTVS